MNQPGYLQRFIQCYMKNVKVQRTNFDGSNNYLANRLLDIS